MNVEIGVELEGASMTQVSKGRGGLIWPSVVALPGVNELIPDEQIFAILLGHPVATSILREVKEFYGETLSIYWQGDENPERSHFRIDVIIPREGIARTSGPESKLKPSAKIWIARKSERKAAALTHELLHARLPALGFCFIVGDTEPAVEGVRNHVEHELILDDFLSAGLSPDSFTRDKIVTTNELERKFEEARKKGKPECVIEKFRRIHYFQALLANARGFAPQETVLYCLERGALSDSEFALDAARIRDWITSSAFRIADSDHSAFNDLLRILRIESVAGCRVHKTGGSLAVSFLWPST